MAASDLSPNSLDSISCFRCVQACGQDAQTRTVYVPRCGNRIRSTSYKSKGHDEGMVRRMLQAELVSVR